MGCVVCHVIQLCAESAVDKAAEEGQEGADGEGDEEGSGGKKASKKSKKSTPGLMIEKNPNNLNAADIDYASRVDPLFQKTAAAFDEGGVEGLLMNNLHVQ